VPPRCGPAALHSDAPKRTAARQIEEQIHQRSHNKAE